MMYRANVNGYECLFAYEERVSVDNYPENFPHKYDIRHDEENWTLPTSIEPFVLVNFLGSIFTKEPVFNESNYIEICSFEVEGNLHPFFLSDELLYRVLDI